MIASHQTKPLQMWAGRIGHFFLVLATLVCAVAGWVFGEGPSGTLEGIAMGVLMACGFGACPWAVAYLLPFVSVARNSGRPGAAVAALIGVIIAGGMELRGELMVFAGKRANSSNEATMQNARYDDARKAVSAIEKQLATAQAKLDEQTGAGTSASYEAQIKAADDLAAREGSKARSGCKQKCDEALKVAASLRARQAIASDRETNTEPLVARLTKELSDARAASAGTKVGRSLSVAESEMLASFWTMNLEPSKDSKMWADRGSGLFMAVFFLIVPTILVFMSKMDLDAPKKQRNRSTILANLSAWLKGEPAPAARETFRAPDIDQPNQEPRRLTVETGAPVFARAA